MDVYTSTGSCEPNLDITGQEFDTDAFKEYRQRVLAQIEDDRKEENINVKSEPTTAEATQSEETFSTTSSTTAATTTATDANTLSQGDSTIATAAVKSDPEPSWDDSDLNSSA